VHAVGFDGDDVPPVASAERRSQARPWANRAAPAASAAKAVAAPPKVAGNDAEWKEF